MKTSIVSPTPNSGEVISILWPGWTRVVTRNAACISELLGAMKSSSAVFETVHRQIGALVVVCRGQLLVDVDAEAGRVARMQHAVGEAIGVREDRVGLRRCGAYIPGCRSWGSTGRSAAPPPCTPATGRSRRGSRCGHCADRRSAAIRRRWVMPPAWTHGRADIVDQLLLDQLLAVPDRVEDLADRERRRGVLADQAESLAWFSAGVASSSQKGR